MKPMIEVFLAGSILICAVIGQEPALRKGVSVQMASADHAVEMRAADAQDATVVAITADGKVYAGIERTEPGALNGLTAAKVYIKADSRAQFQTVLAVLDALRGKSVVLLAAPPKNVGGTKMVPPYGVELMVPR
jgi:biopolymer transport protein ExbD